MHEKRNFTTVNAPRTKGETPKSSFYFSFRPLTKFPIADLGVWRSGSGRRATIEQVQLCVHSRKIAFFVNLQNPDLLSPGPANVGEISPGSAGHSYLGTIFPICHDGKGVGQDVQPLCGAATV